MGSKRRKLLIKELKCKMRFLKRIKGDKTTKGMLNFRPYFDLLNHMANPHQMNQIAGSFPSIIKPLKNVQVNYL